jgi:hypothetical protein
MDQKVKQHIFLKYLWLLHTHTKKVYIESFIKARIRIRFASGGAKHEFASYLGQITFK